VHKGWDNNDEDGMPRTKANGGIDMADHVLASEMEKVLKWILHPVELSPMCIMQ
jgi:hypothetical protein